MVSFYIFDTRQYIPTSMGRCGSKVSQITWVPSNQSNYPNMGRASAGRDLEAIVLGTHVPFSHFPRTLASFFCFFFLHSVPTLPVVPLQIHSISNLKLSRLTMSTRTPLPIYRSTAAHIKLMPRNGIFVYVKESSLKLIAYADGKYTNKWYQCERKYAERLNWIYALGSIVLTTHTYCTVLFDNSSTAEQHATTPYVRSYTVYALHTITITHAISPALTMRIRPGMDHFSIA